MDREELALWIDEYGRDIYSFCMHLTRNRQEADELYQDTWLCVVEKLDQIDSEGNIKSYCLSVAHGIWRNKRRKYAWRKRIVQEVSYEPELEERDLLSDAPSPEEEVLKQQMEESVWNAVNDLPEKLRLGSHNSNAKLTDEQVREIRKTYVPYSKEFGTVALAEKYGVTNRVIGLIVKNKAYKNVK